jgi:hypothetical protein
VFCLPGYKAPALVHPVQGSKAYDLPEADPIPAWGAGAARSAERLFVWSAAGGRDAHSLDYTSLPVRLRRDDPADWAAELASKAVHLGDTLYLGTYAHSMSPAHGTHEDMVFPHEQHAVRTMLETVIEGAERAGLGVAMRTASEVREEIIAGG